MRVRVAVAHYRRRLLRPLATARGSVVEREGFIVSLADSEGRVGHGEAAPISWIDAEALDAVARDLARLGDTIELPLRVLDGGDAQRCAWLEEVAHALRPSARAALDAASLDLATTRAGVSAAERLGAVGGSAVPLNALVVETGPEEVAAAVCARMARGYRVVKLKVGATAPGLDIARVRAARDRLREDAILRLDANAAWRFEVAREVLEAVGPARLDYVEEPLADATTDALTELGLATGVPLAVDESFERLGGADGLAESRCCDVVVLKPARMGGPTPTVAIGRRILASGLRVVLTDAIETAVGRAVVVHAAAALASTGALQAIGLGGLELLAPDSRHERADDVAGATAFLAEGPGLTVRAVRESSIG